MGGNAEAVASATALIAAMVKISSFKFVRVFDRDEAQPLFTRLSHGTLCGRQPHHWHGSCMTGSW